MRRTSPDRIRSLDEIARLAGQRPENWIKPRFGDFEYWLAHQCGWISDHELATDTATYEAKRQRALQTSQRFSRTRYSWIEEPQFEEPQDTAEYVPQVNLRLIKDRNLTDSSRRIAMFVMRHTYQDNRKGRFVGMTVTFIMKGLALSRRTVQRSLTLLETRGYFRCQVAKGEKSRMCVGLIIQLTELLFPKHHKEKWPDKRRNSEASAMPPKQIQFYNSIYNAKIRVSRLTWTLKCMNAITDRVLNTMRPVGEVLPAMAACSATITAGRDNRKRIE